ncbi:DUF3850 domain-containing protein [Lactococcus lactis subsp. lactis]
MKEHELKLDIKYFDDVKSGKKKFEIRKNDRDFQVGDTLRLIAVDSGKYVFKQGIGTIPIKKYKWKKCKKIEAETIRVKILSVMNAELYICDEVVDDVLVMFGAYDLRDVKKVLSNYFKVNKLPDNYVVLGIEKLVKNK